MNIYQTIDVKRDAYFLSEMLSNLQKQAVYGARFNLGRIPEEDLVKETNRLVRIIEGTDVDLEYIFDLPFPKRKSRILKTSIEDNIVEEGKRYLITYDNEIFIRERNCILVDNIQVVNEGQQGVVYYGDGELAFELIGNSKTTDKLEVYALGSEKIRLTKAVNWGFSSAEEELQREVNDTLKYCEKASVAYSFVEGKADILKTQSVNRQMYSIAKIETLRGVKNIDEIIEVSDGILVARGDLGLNIDISSFYDVIKEIVVKTLNAGKRVFYATDIFTSLEYRAFPCRADIMDVGQMLEMGCTDVILPFRDNIDRVIRMLKECMKGQ